MGTQTPWGQSQHKTVCAPGIILYTTARHGGYHVSPTRNELIPAVLRRADGWYEEDCDWGAVVWTFREYFSTKHVQQAERTIIDWAPYAYEALTGAVLQPGQSFRKDADTFESNNKGNYVSMSAYGDHHKEVPAGYVAVHAKRAEPADERWFLVPLAEYRNGQHWFVINPDVHQEITPLA